MALAIVEPGPNIRLTADKDQVVVRDRAISARHFFPGGSILTTTPTTTALIRSEKGKRCDHCHRKSSALLRCKGCASYYYCDANCQVVDWKRVHKRICKNFNAWEAFPAFQALPEHEKMDMLLLSHLMSAIYPLEGLEDPRSELKVLISMMRNPSAEFPKCQPCPMGSTSRNTLAVDLFQRFGRNNFALQSHYTIYAHGVYPMASRVFNHSCVPNAIPKYVIEKGKPVRMEIVALYNIVEGEEIFIPYADPALIQQRIELVGLTYGFLCDCTSCKFFQTFGGMMLRKIPLPPRDMENMVSTLKSFMPCTSAELFTGKRELPSILQCVFHEEFLMKTTKIFSDSSHDGPYDRALVTGEIVLYVYRLIYPTNYPQIGMHLLEMAKTTWNAIVTSEKGGEKEMNELQVLMGKPPVVVFRDYLEEARKNLMIVGEEGDEGGPLDEIQMLEDALASLES